MAAQLRIYDIKDGLMDEWVRMFADHIVPPRRQYGFEILGPWVSSEGTQFIWIASYQGPLEWDEAVDRYYHSPERSSIAFDPSDYIESMDVRTLTEA